MDKDNTFLDFTNDHFHNISTLKDEHDLIKIIDKTPVLQNIGKIVHGDTNSNILTFELDRFYDGEDLSTKKVQFVIKTKDGILVKPAANLQYSDTSIRFSWVLSYYVTTQKTITAAIEIYGTIDDDKDYVFKTTPFTIEVVHSLDSSDMNVCTTSSNLYINLSNRLMKLEKKIHEINMVFEDTHIDFSELMKEVDEVN